MDWNRVDRSNKDSQLPAPCALWPVDLKLTHVDCNPRDTLVHFQGQYVTICELDYNILQVEIQNAQKTKASMAVGEFCLVEDVLSNRWYRGRVQNKQRDLFDVFLLDYGNVLTVNSDHFSVISDALLLLPPKIVCGFFANVLPVQKCWDSSSEKYFSSLIGTHINGHIHAFLPYKVLILEAPEITKNLLRLSLGRYVDTDTFLLLVEMLVEVPVQQSSESVPDLLIEKQSTQELAFRSSSLRGFENILSFSGSKLVVGQNERGRVTAAVNPGLFFCQLSSVAQDLKELSEKLAIACELTSSDCRVKPVENLGLLCAVKGKDEKWHRGFVQCLPVNSQVKVGFVDYGYCESVKVENVLQLPSDFLLTPIMAYPCSLSCLNDKDEDTKSQQLAILRNAILGNGLEFTVNGFSKERNIFAVTLRSFDECSLIETVQPAERTNASILKSDHSTNGFSIWCTDKTKKVKTSEDVLPSEEIQNGSVFEGFVEYILNPHDFWIRTTGRNDRFEDMMNRLTVYFRGLPLSEEILDDPVPGALCCAMYEQDMNYYRAVVVDTFEKGAEVFFIDFGNTEKVPSMLIKKLPSEFAVEPEFALNCSLAHVNPWEDCWTMAATDFFRKATSNKALLIHVLHKRNHTLVVELYARGTENSESISTLLTKANMSGYWKSNLTDAPVELVKEGKTERKKYKKPCWPESHNFNGEEIRQEHLNTQKAAMDKQVQPRSRASAEDIVRHQKILPGSEMKVFCSHFTSPSDFWCQNKQQKADLDRLMKRLQDFYQTNAPELQPHSICCAIKLKQDNRWYRGCTLGVAKDEAKVILIDYGSVVKERLKNIRALKPEFLELEGQAFRCSLYNLIEPDGESVWSQRACVLLKDFIFGDSSNLTCKIYSQLFVVNKGLCNVVDLQTSLQWATAHLVEKGVAVEIKCLKQLVPSAYPCSFVYSSFNISIGSEELVYASHVDSPWEIYLQLDRNSVVIEELMEGTTKKSEELLSQAQCTDSGNVCLAKYFGDGKWYRSMAWPAPSSQHLNVFFVDYGNKQVAEKCNVLPIPRKAVDLLSIPMQALQCSLSGIPKGEHLPEVNAWLENTVLNRAFQAKFVAKDDTGHFICDLFDGNVHINEKVKELFKNQGPQDSTSSGKPSSACKEGMNVCSRFADKLKTRERYRVVRSKTTSERSKVPQDSGQSSQKKSSKFRPSHRKHNLNGGLSKDSQSKENYKVKRQGQISGTVQREPSPSPRTSNVQVLPKMSDLPVVKIKPGYKGVGFISQFDSPERFFIQMEDNEQTILKIGEELNSTFFTENIENITSEVNVGDLVAATFEEDLALYRALVTNVASNDTLTVEFIDYGNTAAVEKKNIHLLTSHFMSHARLSIHCTLSKPYKFKDANSFLLEAHGKPLVVEFVQNLGHAWKVRVDIFGRLHAADVKDEKVLALGQCNARQELTVTETVTKDEEHNHTSFSSVRETTKAEMSSKSKEAKTVTQTSALNCGTQNSKAVQQKSFRKKKGRRITGPMQKLNTKQRKPKDTHIEQDDKNLNRPFDGQDVRIKDCCSDLCKSALVDTATDDLVDNKDQAQQLFLAPVKVDFEYSGFAAAVTTPGEFYIVLEDLLLIMHAVSDILENLPEELSPLPESHLISGTGCLVKSGEKSRWCRAEIVQCNDISVVIHLVDYGHYSHFPRQDIHKLQRLPGEVARLPKITYPCLLRGIKPAVENQWSDSAVIFFQECMCQNNLQIYFRQYVSEGQWEVDVVTGGTNIAKELVDAGHACYIDSVLGIRFQQRLGHRRASQPMSDIRPNFPTPSVDEQTHSKKEERRQGHLNLWSADNAARSREEMSRGCDGEGSKICNFLESGQMTHDGSSFASRQSH